MDDEMNFSLICRICLQREGAMKSVFSLDPSREMKLFEKIEKCSTLKFEEDSLLPELICEKCTADLDAAYRFHVNCDSSDAILRTYLEVYMDQVASELPPPASEDEEQKAEQKDVVDTDIYELVQPFPEVKTEIITAVQEMSDEEKHHIASTEELVVEDDYDVEYLEEDAMKHPIYLQTIEEPAVKQEKTRSNKKPAEEVCVVCGQHYKSKSTLAIHMARHKGEKKYACSECDARFVTRSGATRHMRIHTGDKPYSCQHCQRQFSDYSTRNRHERTHTGERPYVCSHCGLSFSYNHVLATHLLTHTGEKNYECDICFKKFTKSYHLAQHKNVHLKAQGMPYKKYIRPKRIRGAVVKGKTILVNPATDIRIPQEPERHSEEIQIIREEEFNEEPCETEFAVVDIAMSP